MYTDSSQEGKMEILEEMNAEIARWVELNKGEVAMKRLLYALSGLGLVLLFVMGALHERSLLRSTWSFSPFVLSTTAPGTPDPLPTAAAGTLGGEQSVQSVAMIEGSSGRDGGFVETFKNPPEVSSSGGVLNLPLTACVRPPIRTWPTDPLRQWGIKPAHANVSQG